MPSSLAFIFIKPTKLANPPGKVRPSACAARFSLDMSARCNNSPRLNTVPTVRRERLPFSVSTSSWLMVMSSSMGRRASEIRTPVISLVIEAIGKTASSFLCSSTSLVSWSITNATLDLSARASGADLSPAMEPKEGRVGAAATVLALRLALGCVLVRLGLWALRAPRVESCTAKPALAQTVATMNTKQPIRLFINVCPSSMQSSKMGFEAHAKV